MAEWAVVTRPSFDVMLTALTEAQFIFEQRLSAGQCLAEAVDAAFDVEADFELASTLSLMLSLGMFYSVEQSKI